MVGDLQNNPGRSLFVRLTGLGAGSSRQMDRTCCGAGYVRALISPFLSSWLPPGAQHNISAGGKVSLMPRSAADLSSRLARDAEAVCRHYLSRTGGADQYWLVGDVRNAPGGSMFVRLKGPDAASGAASRWTGAASAEHGDLLDVIRELWADAFPQSVLDEARTLPEHPGSRRPNRLSTNRPMFAARRRRRDG